MAGMINKIGDTLKGNKKEEEYKGEHQGQQQKIGQTLPMGGNRKEEYMGEHQGQGQGQVQGRPGQQKEGIVDKMKDKISGGQGKDGKGGMEGGKKKKERKKHEDGHSSSGSDSD